MKLLNQITSIAIGSFDGLHRGHQALISQVEAIVIIERNGGYLTPGHKRSFYTDRICCFYHFDKIKGLSPEGFVAKLLGDFPHLEKIVVGYDFHFGKNKGGNGELLKTLFKGEVKIVEQVTHESVPVHSRMIKQFLKEGDLKMANALLDREFEIEGEVINGQGLGSKKLAKKHLKEIFRLNPNFSLENMRKQNPYRNPNQLEQLISALQEAGLK